MGGSIVPSSGGASDKYGNRYEGYWTVDCIIEVLDNRADLIYLEPQGIEGIEFYLKKNDTIIYYQVKRQNTMGKWTLSKLENEKILSNFHDKLIDPNSVCYFISSYASHEIYELTDGARKQKTFQKFNARLSESKPLKKSFKDLCGYWKCSEQEAFECLKRLHFRTIDEESLIERVQFKLYPLVEGDSATVVDILAQYALKSVTEELSSYEIWKHLKNRGHLPKKITNESKIIKITQDNNARYINYLKSKQIYEDPIPRKEVNEVLKILNSSMKSDVIILGNAGVGKSNIILQTMLELKNKHRPYFVIRADRLNPTVSPKELGLQLGLDDNPVKVLGAIANDKDGVLIIDQLDSMSLISGRHPEFFECVQELVRQSKFYPNLRLLIACREYDLNNDARFINLTEDNKFTRVKVDSLSETEIRDVLKKIGFTHEISGIQLDLFAVPLNLRLLREVLRDSRFDISNLNNPYYLYETFWEYKERRININSRFRVRWTATIDKLCEYMDNKQVFSVPKVILDDYSYDTDLMVSENMLILEQNQFSFFHEEFFDYAFARRFSARDIELADFLLKTEQDLIKRSRVRQILTYERYANYFHYINDVELILKNEKIRFHIKEAVLAFLSQIKDPTDQESDLILNLLKDPSYDYFNNVWKTLYGSVYWYKKIDFINQIQLWLESEDEFYINKALWLSHGVINEIPDRVAELLKPFIDKSELWNFRILDLIDFAPLEKSDKLYNIFLYFIDSGVLDDLNEDGNYGEKLWENLQHTVLRNLSENSPKRACEVIKRYLLRRIHLSGSSSPNIFVNIIPQFQFKDYIFLKIAENDPFSFAKLLLPLMMGIMKNNIINYSVEPFVDRIWRARIFGRPVSSEDILLKSMEKALELLAKKNPKIFTKFESLLIESRLETSIFLLLSSYSANAKEFTNNAVEYILENPKSLETGYADNKFWVTKELIESIRPFCSNELLKSIENVIFNYYPIKLEIYKWASSFYPRLMENIISNHISKCRVQFGLLEATPPYNRSYFISDRLNELKNELNIDSSKPPDTFEPFIVVSPIDQITAENMTDEEWLETIIKYDKERDMLEGGPLEISRQLETIVKDNPERFSRLLYRFPSNANINYYNSVLNGISDSDLDLKDIINACTVCHGLPESPCGKSICEVISKQAHKDLPDEILEIVGWYALNDPDPNEELWDPTNLEGREYFGGKIFTAGINSVRGIAALTIQKLIICDKSRLDFFKPTLEEMVHDPSIAVRSCIVETLRAVLEKDKILGFNLSKKLFNTSEVLLKATPIEYFLYRASVQASNDEFEYILKVINRMIQSNIEDVAVMGAKVATYASVFYDCELPQMRYCLYISEMHRKGVAQVLSANILNLNSLLTSRLVSLFNDSSQEVQMEVSTVFRQLKKDKLNDYEFLINEFINSNAFENHHDQLFWVLEKADVIPEITINACERFFEVTKEESGDIRTSAAGTVNEVSQLVLRNYNESKNSETKNRCLDLIDYMLKIGVYNLENDLSNFERNLDNSTF